MTPGTGITAKEALERVLALAARLPSELLPLDKRAVGRVLAEPLLAPQPSPRWSVSAMDGFALRSADFPGAYGTPLKVLGTAKAGDARQSLSGKGLVRIMTGAVIPLGADAVVPKEQARERAGLVTVLERAGVAAGDHVRVQGEELARGDLAVEAGVRLSSRWIGFLNGIGLASAAVAVLPRTALLVTGSELKRAPAPLKPGQIHDSNGPMLEAALSEQGVQARALRLGDNPVRLKAALKRLLAGADVVILSGGVSVGDADYSKEALAQLGVKTVFWGVEQKPGKPLFFGTKGKTLVFGLPGNPAAAWVCFHEYVRPALWAMQGLAAPAGPRLAVSDSEPKRDPVKTLFLKARLEGPRVVLLGGQQSHMLRSLASADALARVEPGGTGRRLEVGAL